jgi:hypothetical protein
MPQSEDASLSEGETESKEKVQPSDSNITFLPLMPGSSGASLMVRSPTLRKWMGLGQPLEISSTDMSYTPRSSNNSRAQSPKHTNLSFGRRRY